MPRVTIPLVNGEKYHVFNRGVDKRTVFASKSDYLRFYQSMEVFNSIEPSCDYSRSVNKIRIDEDRLVQLHAYSLLPNHFHLILEQLVDDGISNFMKRLSGGYTSYFNETNKRSGSLFQGRFKRVHIDSDEYLNYIFAYVNENHFVHKLKRNSDIYLSSSNHYQGKTSSKLLPNISTEYNFEHAQRLALGISIKRDEEEYEL